MPVKLATLILAGCIVLTGCSSTSPKRYSEIASSHNLTPNPSDASGKIPYAYAPQIDWQQFSNVIIEPVAIYRGSDHQFGDDVSEQDKKKLAMYMEAEFAQKLSQRFKITLTPAPGTLRVRLTLTGVETNMPFISTFLRFDLVGLPYNAVQGIRGKEGIIMGSVSYSVEIYDAATDHLLNAYVTRQYPNAMNVKATFGALGASMAGIRNGAEALLAKLD